MATKDKGFLEALKEVGKEKGIAPEVLFDAVEAALVSAYKRNFNTASNVRVYLERATGDFHVYAQKKVVEKVENKVMEISLDQAKKINDNYELDDVIELAIVSDAVIPAFEYQEGDKYLNPLQKKILTLTDGEWVETEDPQTGVIYVDMDSNKIYRWSGSTAVEISSADLTSKQDKIYAIGLLKGDGLGGVSEAEAGVDYAEGSHTHNANEITGLNVSTDELNYLEGVTSSIQEQLSGKASVDSPALTGVPTAPTAAAGTSTNQVATTEYVQNAIASFSTISYDTI